MKIGGGGLGKAAMKYVVRRSGGRMRRDNVRHWYGLLATMAVRKKEGQRYCSAFLATFPPKPRAP